MYCPASEPLNVSCMWVNWNFANWKSINDFQNKIKKIKLQLPIRPQSLDSSNNDSVCVQMAVGSYEVMSVNQSLWESIWLLNRLPQHFKQYISEYGCMLRSHSVWYLCVLGTSVCFQETRPEPLCNHVAIVYNDTTIHNLNNNSSEKGIWRN